MKIVACESPAASEVFDIEIRVHGRGGQGGVTCAKILSAVYAQLGKSVQSFGDYAGERAGAPIRAYTRVSDRPVTNRNKVYQPDHLLVLDPTLLEDGAITTGLEHGGLLVLNTTQPLASFDRRFERFRLAVVDGTAIARRHGIGTRSVVIVSTTMAGAFARAVGLPLDALSAIEALGYSPANMRAAKDAYEGVQIREPLVALADGGGARSASPGLPEVMSLVEATEGLPTGLRTGSWRTQMPRYVNKLAPCSARCPAGNDVVGFVQALARDGENAAAAILGRTTPLAAVCGRVCPAPCMEGCNRKELDGAVNVRGIERWIADHARVVPVAASRAEALERRLHAPIKKKVAIVGGGPAGLAAAYELARAGQDAVIYDGEQQLGGVLRTGIPKYRLPRAELDREVADVLELGVKAKLGEWLDASRIAGLVREHDGVILATGLQKNRSVDGPGADLDGVEQGLSFLHRVNLAGPVTLSGHVVVLGGGNTAMDCARSAVRAGADRVTVAYRRSREEMPAIAEEVHQAEEEGVHMLFLRAPMGFKGAGRVQTVTLAEVDLGPPDESGRRRPVVTDRLTELAVDHVLLALGQSADTSKLPAGWEIVDGRILERGRPLPVFAAGDFATNEGTVTHAIGDGRRAAIRAMIALGIEVSPFERRDPAKAVKASAIRFDHFAKSGALMDRHAPAGPRARTFEEVSAGLASSEEAFRCFSCGDCTHCDTCLIYCPEGIIHREANGYSVDLDFCKGCGICVVECPRQAMEMTAL